MASLIRACGGRSEDAGLAGLDPQRLETARHVVLLVVDGLGYDILQQSGSGAVLRRYLAGSMSSVYPPTTATAVTTYLTGLAPSQHGLTGWFMYFRELGGIVTVLPFTTRLGSVPLASHRIGARDFLGHEPVFDRLAVPSYSISPARIAHSEFNLAHKGCAELISYDSMHGFFGRIADVARRGDRRAFTYAYWPDLDQISHHHGSRREKAVRHLAELDAGFDALLRQLAGTDTLLIVTADHGFADIDSSHIVHLAEHPALADSLRVPLCGEPRTAYCYVAAERQREFLDYVELELREAAHCVASQSLIEEGVFGPGPCHPGLRERVGDFTLLMRDGYAIMQTLPGEETPKLIGMHGGCSAAELRVPLILAEA